MLNIKLERLCSAKRSLKDWVFSKRQKVSLKKFQSTRSVLVTTFHTRHFMTSSGRYRKKIIRGKRSNGNDKNPWIFAHTEERLILSRAKNIGRETEGLMLSINRQHNFYYLLKFHDMRCKALKTIWKPSGIKFTHI